MKSETWWCIKNDDGFLIPFACGRTRKGAWENLAWTQQGCCNYRQVREDNPDYRCVRIRVTELRQQRKAKR